MWQLRCKRARARASEQEREREKVRERERERERKEDGEKLKEAREKKGGAEGELYRSSLFRIDFHPKEADNSP
jgi:hypothetical protein